METLTEKLNILLSGGDLRSVSGADEAAKIIRSQQDFDVLFSYMYNSDRLIVMRAADAAEKASKKHSSFLDSHKADLIALTSEAQDKELKWHLAQMVCRLKMDDHEKNEVFRILKSRALDKDESRIVRVNSVQALYEISRGSEPLSKNFNEIINDIRKENIPSLNARIKKLI